MGSEHIACKTVSIAVPGDKPSFESLPVSVFTMRMAALVGGLTINPEPEPLMLIIGVVVGELTEQEIPLEQFVLTLVTVPVPAGAGSVAAAACNALVTFCVPPVIVRAVLKQY